MTNIFIFIFWTSIFCIALTYFLYPLMLAIVTPFVKKPVKKRDIEPMVSLIIAAHNEERDIALKIDESLELDYPADKLQIIVASDASMDATDTIVRSYKGKRVLLVRQNNRLGKTAVQNKAIDIARGEIIVFSDATTRFDKEVIKKLVRNFADEKIGCVGAELVYTDGIHGGLGKVRNIYWSYEKFFKKRESKLNSLVGVSGCCYAVRKEAYKKLNPKLISDFAITWILYEQGYRSVLEPEAKVYEDVIESQQDEVRMRVRLTSRSLIAFKIMKRLLNPIRFGFFSFQLIAHKVLRYFVPVFGIMILLSSIALLDRQPYRSFLYLELMFFVSAAVGIVSNKKSPFYTLFYFTYGNYAVLRGLLKAMNSRHKNDMWRPLRKNYEKAKYN